MQNNVVIAVIAGTIRPKRRSHKVAEWVAQQGQGIDNVEIIYVDPVSFNFPSEGDDEDAKDPRFSEIVARADGFLIVTPEYNHSFPGSLKRMLDSEFDNYLHKAVAICGVSNGDWGGTRAVESLIPVCKAFGLAITKFSVYFNHVGDLFGDDGQMKLEHSEKYTKYISGVYGELIWLASALKQARSQGEQ